MKRTTILIYGIISYIAFLAAFLYAIGFTGNLVVPKSIDAPPATGGSIGWAILINALLLGAFAVQHSVMARPAFKRWWTKIIPPAAERSTYVLLASLLLFLLYWQWQPMNQIIWDVQAEWLRWVLYGLFWVGWLTVLLSTFMINHFDLFGLKQAIDNWRERQPVQLSFMVKGLYRFVRHPIMLGFIIAFWATPTMTAGHLLFAVVTTAYMILAISQFEEKDLVAVHGNDYETYKEEVPMIVPFTK